MKRYWFPISFMALPDDQPAQQNARPMFSTRLLLRGAKQITKPMN